MNSLRRLLTLLQDPLLVAKFQKFCGIKSVPPAITSDSERYQITADRNDPGSTRGHQVDLSVDRPRPLTVSDGSDSTLRRIRRVETDEATSLSSTSVSTLSAIGNILFEPIVAEADTSLLSTAFSSSPTSPCEECHVHGSFEVTRPFWHVVFLIGSALGDEVFYASFLPLWFWNVDGAVGRRAVLVWLATMYIGQAMKDLLQIPRPACPPVIRVAKKWALEFGFPSTHSMVAVALPGALLAFTHGRYQYPMYLGFAFATVWCLCICCSRIYLGMHSVLDVLAGLLLGAVVLAALIPVADTIDNFLLTHQHAPFFFSSFVVTLVYLYPSSDRWNPARGDTVIICAVVLGFYCGSWLNYNQRLISAPSAPPPYVIIWPTYRMLGQAVARSVLGLCSVVATRAVFKALSSTGARALLGLVQRSCGPHVQPINVELCYKFVTYVAVGIDIVYTAPLVFRLLQIGRPEYYTEV